MTKILIEIDTDTQRVVPVEPTEEMCEAAYFGPNCAEEKLCGSYREFWEECYRAMLAAAPQPEMVDVDLRRDAERYLFLRDKWWFCGVGDYLVRTALAAEELDSAIDAAMSQGEQK